MRVKILVSCLLLWISIFGWGCTHESKFSSITSPIDTFCDCLSIFPDRPWEAVHRIEAKLGMHGSYSYIGLTEGDPGRGNIRCAILTAEGFVLFEAERQEDRITITKAMPPFDSSYFAKGLIEDVELIFFAPQERPSEFGKVADGALVCRWMGPSGLTKEIRKIHNELWKISLWNDQQELKREVWITKRPTENVASQIELHASEVFDYRLKMVLVE